MTVLLIDNYDSFTFNLFQFVQELVADPVVVYRNDAVDLAGILEHRPSHIILSPGPGHPGIDADFGVCREVILEQERHGCPVLGVCLGHQGIVHHFGGRVQRAPQIVHGKTSYVRFTRESLLFDGLSNPFLAMRYHSLVVADEDFPSALEVTARDVDHSLVMAVEHSSKPLYGIQFHPESIGTPEGKQLLRNFIEKC
jgi:anthranilate synthase component II